MAMMTEAMEQPYQEAAQYVRGRDTAYMNHHLNHISHEAGYPACRVLPLSAERYTSYSSLVLSGKPSERYIGIPLSIAKIKCYEVVDGEQIKYLGGAPAINQPAYTNYCEKKCNKLA